ncbi:hypothetical protein LCGC14_2263650, partial [marine sediment metagenome]
KLMDVWQDELNYLETIIGGEQGAGFGSIGTGAKAAAGDGFKTTEKSGIKYQIAK